MKAQQASTLRREIAAMARKRVRRHPQALPEQPFDSNLMALSPLYRRSRQIFLEEGGKFRAALVSSPRTLSSVALLGSIIEYSPIERELIWAATDPRERRHSDHLLDIRTFASSLFHEQSHRILWKMLPPAPRGSGALRRYLNFAESLVITADMALADELGPVTAKPFYLSGVIYDPGTKVRKHLNGRMYRNYLQAALHATWLTLEMYEARRIPKVIEAMFPMLGPLAKKVADRCGTLDKDFVGRTNPVWQYKHLNAVRKALARKGEPGLELPDHPTDNRLQYLFAEKWFERMGL